MAIQELMRVVWDFPNEQEVVDEALMAASGIYESQGEFSHAVKLYSMVVHRDLPSKKLAEKRMKALKTRTAFDHGLCESYTTHLLVIIEKN